MATSQLFHFSRLPSEIRLLILGEVVLAAIYSTSHAARLVWVRTAEGVVDVNRQIAADMYGAAYQQEPRFTRRKSSSKPKDALASAAVVRLSGRLEMRFRNKYRGMTLDGFQYDDGIEERAKGGDLKATWLTIKYSGLPI